MHGVLAKYLYTAIFCVFLPLYLLLVTWQMEQRNLPVFPLRLEPVYGLAVALVGAGMILLAMYTLVSRGNGLPSNASPTRNWVTTGIYRLFDHPIYLGFIIFVAGTAIAMSSPVGFWLITPLCFLGCCSLVIGYEAQATNSRLGARPSETFFKIPPNSTNTATFNDKMIAGVLSIGGFAALFGLFSTVPTSQFAFDLRFAWERGFKANSVAVLLYSFTYLPILIIPFVFQRLNELRRLVIASWLAMIVGFSLMIVLPIKAVWLNGDLNWVAQSLLELNREWDAEWLSFPSFHIYWSCLCACAFSSRWPNLKFLFGFVVVGVAASCILSGQHSIADLFAGLILFIFCWNYELNFQRVLRIVERVANSWNSIEFLSMRILFSGVAATIASLLGAMAAYSLIDENYHFLMFMLFLSGLSGALLFGHTIEGSEKLSRPFGYFGFIVGSSLCAAAVVSLTDLAVGALCIAALIGGSIAQGVGRVRCLIQGCCHGRSCHQSKGITYRNSKTRVVAFEKLVEHTIYPTQLYSLVFCLLLSALMLAMLAYHWPWTFIAGHYFIWAGMFRFAEESLRGETQTPHLAGLSLYQYLAIGMLIVGMILITIPSIALQFEFEANASSIWFSIATALIVFIAMAVDFPGSDKPLSRLAPR